MLIFLFHCYVCVLPGKTILEMTYTVSVGTLNSTHSLTLVVFDI